MFSIYDILQDALDKHKALWDEFWYERITFEEYATQSVEMVQALRLATKAIEKHYRMALKRGV